jgi:hypothetical protein
MSHYSACSSPSKRQRGSDKMAKGYHAVVAQTEKTAITAQEQVVKNGQELQTMLQQLQQQEVADSINRWNFLYHVHVTGWVDRRPLFPPVDGVLYPSLE